MRVFTYGLALQAGHDHLSLADIFAAMQLENGKPDDSQRIQRRFYIDDSNGEFYKGLVVTVRDQRAFCKLFDSGSTTTIQVENLGSTEKIMDFNLFVVRKKNGLGLYQSYHRSCPLNTFVGYLKRKYRAMSMEKRDQEIALAQKEGASEKIKRSIRRKYVDALRGGPLVTPETFDSVLQKYGDLRSFSFEITSMQHRAVAAGPLDPLVKRVRQTVTFSNDAPKGKVVQAIHKVMENINLRTARVLVLDEDEESVSLRLQDIPTSFAETEYDDLVTQLQGLDLASFKSNAIIDDLIKICGSRPEIFNQEFA